MEIGTTTKVNKIDGGQGGAKSPHDIDWLKGNFLPHGPDAALRYNRQLMVALLNDRLPIADIVDARAISLNAGGYAEFDKGATAEFELNPNGLLGTLP